MSSESILLIGLGMAVIAFLYSSVGHAGASGYIAVMSLAGLSLSDIRPTALLLNVFVASIASWQFVRAGHFSWKLFWPISILAAPSAFAGGYLKLPHSTFHWLVGGVLIFSAVRFMGKSRDNQELRPLSTRTAMAWGIVIGFMAGLTGTGGGIFLTPLLLLLRWANARTAAAVSALFILLNSTAGLLGYLWANQSVPEFAWYWGPGVVIAGFCGSYLGSRHYSESMIKKVLALVLLIAGIKLTLFQ